MTKQEQRQQLWDTMTVNDSIKKDDKILVANVDSDADKIVQKILANKGRYESIAHTFPNPGLKWWLVAIIHNLECSLNFSCYLGNGQPLNQKTTIVPKDRGPFKSFEEGAIDAIKLKKIDKVTDWSIGNVLFILEGFNGYGYADYKGINSPYLWSGTNQYVSGKYVKDGAAGYDKDYVSSQIGVAILLKKLINE